MTERELNQISLMVKKAMSQSTHVANIILKEQNKLKRTMSPEEVILFIWNRLICPKCETFALRSDGHTPEDPVCECSNCGYHGSAISIQKYVKDGYYK